MNKPEVLFVCVHDAPPIRELWDLSSPEQLWDLSSPEQ